MTTLPYISGKLATWFGNWFQTKMGLRHIQVKSGILLAEAMAKVCVVNPGAEQAKLLQSYILKIYEGWDKGYLRGYSPTSGGVIIQVVCFGERSYNFFVAEDELGEVEHILPFMHRLNDLCPTIPKSQTVTMQDWNLLRNALD